MCPTNPANFNIDNVRVAKIVGGGINDCCVVRGMVLKCDAVGTIKHAKKAKVNFIPIKVKLFTILYQN